MIRLIQLKEMYDDQQRLLRVSSTYGQLTISENIGTYLDKYILYQYGKILIDETDFSDALDMWIGLNADSLNRIYDALQIEYDPTKYTEHEQHVSGERTADYISHAYTDGKNITTETIPTTKSSRYTTTYDSASDNRLESYDVNEPTGTNPSESGSAVIKSTSYQESVDGKKGATSEIGYGDDVEESTSELETSGHTARAEETLRERDHEDIADRISREIELRIRDRYCDIFCERFLRDLTTCMYREEGIRYDGDFIY